MALGRMLNGYADRYIQTGSATPIIHVVTTVGFGGYVYHSLLHWLESSSAQKYFTQRTESLQTQIAEKEREIKSTVAQRKAAEEELKRTKAGAQMVAEQLQDLKIQIPRLDMELKDMKEKLEEHVNNPPGH